MMINKVLSNISHKKVISNQKKITLDVKIKNKQIFYDLAKIMEKTNGYRKILIKIFEDMDKFEFDKASSVTNGDTLFAEYDFTEIKLYEHTLNVFAEMLKIVDKETQGREVLILLALLHDFGKSNALCKHYKITKEEKHWIRSSQYFNTIIEEDRDFFDLDETAIQIIRYVLSIHHDSLTTEADKQNRYRNELVKADRAARESEKLKLKKAV
ncbi:HD domain-containing protein [Sulfurimonas sp.]|uniref:HD domain-containing protein n=1 Tax=Sulfurimonas sp. TaxID=2022749 RepID=UPI0025F23EEC|nr:HD domain-containing protein [Sulfurimonas sp.]MBW6487571.1 HD domain-containing protein [Sulfurimonas sp.]